MPQFSITPPAIEAETKSGTQLAADLSSLNGAINSSHEGATAPTYAGSGLVWSSKTGDQVNVKDSVGNYILGHRPITSIADLRSFGAGLKEKDVVRIQVSGEIFDYYWDSTSEEADNGTTILLPADWTDPGRWKRLTGSATGVNWWTTEEAAVIYDGSPEYFIVAGDKTDIYVKNRALTLTQTTDALVYVASSALDCAGDTVVQVIGGEVDSGISAVGFGQPDGNQPYSTSMDNPMTTAGDIIVGGASGTPERLDVGSSGKVLKSNGTTPIYDDSLPIADAGGTVDAITATYTTGVVTLTDKMQVRVVAAGANTSTTPTFAPNGLTAYTIVKQGGVALAAGDIKGEGHVLDLVYNLANTRWELLNPASSSGLGVLKSVGIATKSDTFSTSSTTYVDITGLSVNVAMTAGKTYIITAVTHGAADDSSFLALAVDGTQIGLGDSAGSRSPAGGEVFTSSITGYAEGVTVKATFVSASTSTQTVSLQARVYTSGKTIYINRTKNDTDANYSGRLYSILTIEEVQ